MCILTLPRSRKQVMHTTMQSQLERVAMQCILQHSVVLSVGSFHMHHNGTPPCIQTDAKFCAFVVDVFCAHYDECYLKAFRRFCLARQKPGCSRCGIGDAANSNPASKAKKACCRCATEWCCKNCSPNRDSTAAGKRTSLTAVISSTCITNETGRTGNKSSKQRFGSQTV